MRLPSSLVVGLYLAAVSPLLPAQSASYSLFGTDCTTGRITPGIGAVPLSVRGLPRLGTTFEIVTESTTRYPFDHSRQVLLLTGFSNTSAGGVRLPFDVSTLLPGEPFCGMLYTSGEIVTPVPFQQSYLTPSVVAISIPNSTELLGLVFYQQVVSIERSTFGPPFFALALSRGGRGAIGR